MAERIDRAEFAGKVAVVASGSLGIGRAAARRLEAGGAAVVLRGRRPEHVAATTAEVRQAGGEVVGIEADVATAAGAERLIGTAVERFVGLDVVVNSQGIQRYGTVVETSEELWDEVLTTNLKSMVLVSRAAIPELRKRGGGAIVLVSSVQGLATQKAVAAYSTSKAAINGLARTMGPDHAHEKIRVNAVCPASVDTPMLRWAADLFKGEQSQEAMLTA